MRKRISSIPPFSLVSDSVGIELLLQNGVRPSKVFSALQVARLTAKTITNKPSKNVPAPTRVMPAACSSCGGSGELSRPGGYVVACACEAGR